MLTARQPLFPVAKNVSRDSEEAEKRYWPRDHGMVGYIFTSEIEDEEYTTMYLRASNRRSKVWSIEGGDKRHAMRRREKDSVPFFAYRHRFHRVSTAVQRFVPVLTHTLSMSPRGFENRATQKHSRSRSLIGRETGGLYSDWSKRTVVHSRVHALKWVLAEKLLLIYDYENLLHGRFLTAFWEWDIE